MTTIAAARSTRLMPLLALLAGAQAAWSADGLPISEPSESVPAKARTPERARWSWNQSDAEVLPQGELKWTPAPFAFEHGKTVRYIDFEHGSDDADGASTTTAWKHHPWDPQATGTAKAAGGPTTYVFRRGVIYRGELIAPPNASGTAEDPIRLTCDPAWGAGEAEICGTEPVTGWTKGAGRGDIPDADQVWWAEVPYRTRSVWVRGANGLERVDLARIPHWQVTDPDDINLGWWRFENPLWWENGCMKWATKFQGHKVWTGVDKAHLTEPADHYVGAIAHVEYGWVMGTPFPTRVEGWDAANHGFYFQGIWWGASEHITAGMHYYLEDKSWFLKEPNEFWYDEQAKRLYVRLPGDADPSTAKIEAAEHINLIDARGLSHAVISGLSFRGTNETWDLVQPPWADPQINNAAIRVRDTAVDLTVANCRFDHVAKAVRIDANDNPPEHRQNCPLDRIVIRDNDISQTDHGAITVDSHGVGDVKILRNHLNTIGLRNFRQDHSFAIWVRSPETMEVAGNFIERGIACGIFCTGGGLDFTELPLSRNLVHHNRADQCMLSANDWGSIETNCGPFYNYDNIAAETCGLTAGWSPNGDGNGHLGMSYYWDHGYDVAGFNLIAYGSSDKWDSKRVSHAGVYQAAAVIEDKLFNSTITQVWTANLWSPIGGRQLILGNVIDDIGGHVFLHGKLKEDTLHPEGAYPHQTMAYSSNVFSRTPSAIRTGKDGSRIIDFATYESTGTGYANLEDMVKSFAKHPALADDVGVMSVGSPLADVDKRDFRPKAGSAAIGRGVKMFLPWEIARVVGEWHFRQNHADPAVILDDHFHWTQYLNGENPSQAPVYNLSGHGIAAGDYGRSPLEDWTNTALSFNGKDQWLGITQEALATPFSYQQGKDKKTASGSQLWNPDIATSNLLIECYCRAARGAGPMVLVSKCKGGVGYQLAISKAGGVSISLGAGGTAAQLASGAIVADGAWHHVLAEVDRAAASGTIYTDGVATAHGALALPRDASLANDGDLLVGKGPDGQLYTGSIAFLRIARATLAESKTSIAELYDWEFDGPFLRDFCGRDLKDAKRDAGAVQH